MACARTGIWTVSSCLQIPDFSSLVFTDHNLINSSVIKAALSVWSFNGSRKYLGISWPKRIAQDMLERPRGWLSRLMRASYQGWCSWREEEAHRGALLLKSRVCVCGAPVLRTQQARLAQQGERLLENGVSCPWFEHHFHFHQKPLF